ncbi:hypothetical protein EHO61_09640 [Leptospira fluminis]|uniref:Cytochrome C n=1 Tax=Leptospira fluminis TaxID=2484979 RepID=A0A4R9GP28_9LEPT|nr:hypothetical protein [Leptospira fluminis]TGK18717.1 hypothetical protein EHO61_09640 [Leptospira fluminis]
MFRKYLIYTGWLLWIGTLATLVFVLTEGKISTEPDGRKAILLNEQEKDFVLAEMRTLLATVHEIQSSLADEDYERAAKAARKSGRGMDHSSETAEKGLLRKVPLEFKKLGFGTHDHFDFLADTLNEKRDLKYSVRELAKLTSKCVACHSMYKIRIEREKSE